MTVQGTQIKKEIRIGTWQELVAVRAALPHIEPVPGAAAALYRGENSRNVGLQPTLLRELLAARAPVTIERALEIEESLIKSFFDSAHLHTSYPPEITLRDAWALMQHHGAPTRLLDWTTSFFVAVYFAVGDLDEKHPGYVWAMDHNEYLGNSAPVPIPNSWDDQGAFFKKHAKDNLLAAIQSSRKTDRMVAQQGVFTICTNPMADHLSILEQHLVKLVIDGAFKLECCRRLRDMNITAATLFPGVDGLGRAATEAVRVLVRWPTAQQSTRAPAAE